jgi:hypothetical protein
VAATRDYVQAVMNDVVVMPLYWDVDPILALARVKNLKPAPALHTWNVYEWEAS